MSLADEETRARAYRTSQRRRCAAERAREASLRGSGSASQGLYERTEALRRDEGYDGYEEECREHPEQQV